MKNKKSIKNNDLNSENTEMVPVPTHKTWMIK